MLSWQCEGPKGERLAETLLEYLTVLETGLEEVKAAAKSLPQGSPLVRLQTRLAELVGGYAAQIPTV